MIYLIKKYYIKLLEKEYHKTGRLWERYDENGPAADLEYPTQKMLDILAEVTDITKTWNEMVAQDISREELELFLAVKEIRKADHTLIHQALNAVSHSVKLCNARTLTHLREHTANNTAKRCVDCRRRTARLTDDRISVKFFHR